MKTDAPARQRKTEAALAALEQDRFDRTAVKLTVPALVRCECGAWKHEGKACAWCTTKEGREL